MNNLQKLLEEIKTMESILDYMTKIQAKASPSLKADISAQERIAYNVSKSYEVFIGIIELIGDTKIEYFEDGDGDYAHNKMIQDVVYESQPLTNNHKRAMDRIANMAFHFMDDARKSINVEELEEFLPSYKKQIKEFLSSLA